MRSCASLFASASLFALQVAVPAVRFAGVQGKEEIDAILYEAGLKETPDRMETSEGSRSSTITPKRSRSGSGSSRRLGKSNSATEAHSQQAGFSAKHGDLTFELDKNGNPIRLSKHLFGQVICL